MAKPEWGTKRICQGCGARYYDLCRDPAVCPKCGAKFVTKPVVRQRRPLPTGAAEKAPPVPVREAVSNEIAAAVAETQKDEAIEAVAGEDLTETDKEADELESDDDDNSLIEDASDLGEDEDDVSEVLEHVVDDDVSDRS